MDNKEPAYVKVYLYNISKNKSVRNIINPVLFEVLKRTVPANEEHGQRIYLTEKIKKEIAESCGVSIRRVKQEITDYIEAGILWHKGYSLYQINPYLFGKGRYENIHNKVE